MTSVKRQTLLGTAVALGSLVLILSVLSCDGDNNGGDGSIVERVCAPGSTQECYCAVDVQGIQICSDDGSKWGKCESCQSFEDVGSDGGVKDAGIDAGIQDAEYDAGSSDSGHDVDTTDGGPDGGAPLDAGRDAGPDGAVDAGLDAGHDVGHPIGDGGGDGGSDDGGPGTTCGPSPTGKGGDMCDAPTGQFMMGCNLAVDSECFNDSEKPYHQVTVPSFKIDKYEVTVADYKACVDSGGCTVPIGTDATCNYDVSGNENHPVNCVDWNQAKAFCVWAGKRLPSEAEWERAARGSHSWKYPWGVGLDCVHAVMSVSPCSNSGTAPVGSRPKGASPYGVLDMIGNVWEWLEDDWHDSYDTNGDGYQAGGDNGKDGPSDGSAWVENPRGPYRMIRGGSWNATSPLYLRASARESSLTTTTGEGYGFRCSL